MPSLVLGGRAACKLPKDTMKLGIAAEACFKGGLKESGGVTGLAQHFILLEETLHALSIAELDDGETCLLLEQAAEARRAEACVVSQIVEVAG